MEYPTSQFDYLFLLNIPIPISLVSGEILVLETPSLYDYHVYYDLKLLEQVFLVSIMELQMNPAKYGFIAEGYLDIILGLKITNEAKDMFTALERIAKVKVDKQGVTFRGKLLVEEDILEIRYAFLLAMGRIDIEGNFIGQPDEEDDELSKKVRESEARVKAILDAGGKKEAERSFKEVLLFIMYELNKTAEELQKLNFFGISELYKLANMAAYDKISKTAAGNGLLDEKHPYKTILS